MAALAVTIVASLVGFVTLAGVAVAAALLLLGGVGVLAKGVASIPAVHRLGDRAEDAVAARLARRTRSDGDGEPRP
jgi:hypothetical protein